MTETRKTTQEERIKIVKECLENGKNYGKIAMKYQVSYQQAYTWVRKFLEMGGLGGPTRPADEAANTADAGGRDERADYPVGA